MAEQLDNAKTAKKSTKTSEYHGRLLDLALENNDPILALCFRHSLLNDDESHFEQKQPHELNVCHSCFHQRNAESFLKSRIRPRYPQTPLINKLLTRLKRGQKLTRSERRRLKSFRKSRPVLAVPCPNCDYLAKFRLTDINTNKRSATQALKALKPKLPTKQEGRSVSKATSLSLAKNVSGPSQLKKTVEKRRNMLQQQLHGKSIGGSVLQSFLEGLKK